MNIGGVTREAVPGDYESGSFMEKQVPSETDFEILLKKGVSLANLRAIDNATLTLETDIGTSYIVRNAYCADAITVGQEGSAKVKFMGRRRRKCCEPHPRHLQPQAPDHSRNPRCAGSGARGGLRDVGACIVVKRPRAKDLKIMDQYAGREIAGSMALLARVSTLSEEEVELLDADDLGELGNLLGKASPNGQPTGQPA
jgi:hypothetical protein